MKEFKLIKIVFHYVMHHKMKMNLTLYARDRFPRKYELLKLTPEKKENSNQYIPTEDAKLSKSKPLQKYQAQNIPRGILTHHYVKKWFGGLENLRKQSERRKIPNFYHSNLLF